MELKYLWNIILKRKPFVLTSFGVVVLATLLICIFVTENYVTVARIKVKRADESQLLANVPPSFGTLDYIAPTAATTQAEVIKSAAVVKPVIEELNLVERLTIVDTIKSFIPFYYVEPKTLTRVDHLVDASYVGWFLQRRNVNVTSIADSDIVEIYAYSDDLEEAKNIANGIVESYIRFNESLKDQQGGIGVNLIRNELVRVQQELDEANFELQKMQEKEIFLDFDSQTKSITDEKQRLEKELFDLRRDLKTSHSLLKAIMQDLKSQPEFIITETSSRSNPVIDIIKEDLALAKAELAGSSVELKPNHVEYKRLQSKIEQLEKSLGEEPEVVFNSEQKALNQVREILRQQQSDLRVKVEELQAKDKLITTDIQAYSKLLTALVDKKRILENLERNVRVKENEFNKLNDDLGAARLAESSAVTNVNVITEAPIPDKTDPYYPDFPLYMLVALFVGPLVGIGMAFLVEYVENPLNNREQIEEKLGLSVLASLPTLKKKLTNPLKYFELRATFACLLEEFNHSLSKRKNGNGEPTVIAISSAVTGEGSSTIVCALAYSLALSGQRIVAVDLDFDRPALHKYFQVSIRSGCVDLLNGNVSVQQALHATDYSNLDLILCGPEIRDGQDVLEGSKISGLLTELGSTHDVVLIDAGAILSSTETTIIAKHADGLILVMVPGRTRNIDAVKAKEKITDSGAKIIGVIQNRT